MAQYFQINSYEFAFESGYLSSIPNPISLTVYGNDLTQKFQYKIMSNVELAIARANAKLLSSQGYHLSARNEARNAIIDYFSSLADTMQFSGRQNQRSWLLDVKNALADADLYTDSDLEQISVSLQASNDLANNSYILLYSEYGINETTFIVEMFSIIQNYYNNDGNLYNEYGPMASQISSEMATIRHLRDNGVFNGLKGAVEQAGNECANHYTSRQNLINQLASKTAERDLLLATYPADEAIINEEFAVVNNLLNVAIAYHTNSYNYLLNHYRTLLNKAFELESIGGVAGGYSAELADLEQSFWNYHGAVSSSLAPVSYVIRDWAEILKNNAYNARSHRWWLASEQTNGRVSVTSAENALSLANAKLANAIANGLTSMVPALEAEVATAEAAVESALSTYNSQLASIANSLFGYEVEAQYSVLKLQAAYAEAYADGIWDYSNPQYTYYNAEGSISSQKAYEIAEARIAAEQDYEQQ